MEPTFVFFIQLFGNPDFKNHSFLGAKAAACAATFPPAIALKIEEAKLAADRIPQGSIICVNAETGQFLVPQVDALSVLAFTPLRNLTFCVVCAQVNNPGKYTRVTLDEVGNGGLGACDSGCMLQQLTPCPHVIAAAMFAGKDLQEVVHPCIMASYWKVQYNENPFELPSDADIQRFAHLANDNIRLHPMRKRRRGRPKKGARFQSALEKAQKNKEKRAVTCHYCFKKGHTSRSCKHAKEAKAAAAEAAAPAAADDEN